MTESICKNGAFVDAPTLGDEPFVYQYMRTDGHRLLCADRYIELLDGASWRLRSCGSGLTATEVAERVGQLLWHNGYPSDRSNVVLLRSYGAGDYVLSCCGTSLYDALSLRALRPHAMVVEAGCAFAGLPTSATFAEARMLADYVREQGAGAFVAVDLAGRVVSVDGATPFAVRRGTIALSPRSMSAEAEIVMRVLEKAGRRVELREILRDELFAADELWGVDYRGITSVAECEGRAYSDIIADVTARQL